MKWSKRLSRYTLPGMGLKWDASYFGLLFLAMVLIVLYTFLREYQNALRELYIFRYGTQILRQGAVMPTLNTLLRHKFTVFWAYTTFCALRAFANYWSFFTETKSIYLMKRLKDPNELRRRCIAIPAAACGGLRRGAGSVFAVVTGVRSDLPNRCSGTLYAAGGNFKYLGGVFLMLEIKNLCKRYGQTQALDNVQLSVGPGEIVGLFGENGAGKTTLMKCILQLILYDAGGITLDGKLITRQNIGRFSFATCEHSFFPALTAKAHREFYEEHFETFLGRRFEGLMDFFQLPMDKPIRSFSTGQKNQFEVIMALSQGADYILMDEPFAGNDVFNREDFYKVLLGILEPHETVILSTHLIEEVTGFIGRAVLLHKGQIAGDVQTTELDEQGKTLMDYVKETYSYQSDRVSRALTELTGKEDEDA